MDASLTRSTRSVFAAGFIPVILCVCCAAPSPAHVGSLEPGSSNVDARLAEVARVHGGAGPWAVAGYRMGEYALRTLGLTRGSFDLDVVHHTPREVQYACIADGASAATGASLGKLNLTLEVATGPETRTTYRRKSTFRAVTLRVAAAFSKRFIDVPRAGLAEAGREAMLLPDADVFEAVPAPNDGIPFSGVDGDYSSDEPGERTADGGAACRADYATGGRNPRLVRLVHDETFSFYDDRAGSRPLAEGCTYKRVGVAPDPRYFGIAEGQSPTSLWLTYELAAGSPACDAKFHFVAIRPPEGAGSKKHLHLRYGSKATTLEALVRLSVEPQRSACDPWWSVYCTRGNTACDED